MSRLYVLSEATAARRRFPLYLVDATDGITPETGESAGQPQISKAGGAWANTTATLTAIGNGAYYVELTATELNTLGMIQVRYKSANTAEFNMDGEVVAIDIHDTVRLGLTALPNVASGSAGAIITAGTGTAQLSVASGRGNADVTHIATAAVNTASAQLGVNVVQAGATAWGSGAITAGSIASDAITAAKIADGAIDAATFAAGAINAAAIAADAITDAKVASDVTIASVTGAVGSVTGAVGSVTGNVGGNVVGSVGSIATGGIAAASFAAGAIDAAALAADAGTEIGTAVWATTTRVLTAATNITAAIADQVWLETLADHSGTAGSTAAALNAAGSAGDPWNTALPGAYGAGSAGKIIGDNINATISSRLASASYTAPLDAAATRTAVGLASANLDTQLADIPTVAEMNARTLVAASYSTVTTSQVNAEVVDALATDTYAEPGSVPAATATLAAKIGWLFALARNKLTQTATTQTLRNDADSGNIATSTHSDDLTTHTRGEWS